MESGNTNCIRLKIDDTPYQFQKKCKSMNLSQAALSKLWQQQMKPVQQHVLQPSKEMGGKDLDQGSSALTFDSFSRTLSADYSSSRILESEFRKNCRNIETCFFELKHKAAVALSKKSMF